MMTPFERRRRYLARHQAETSAQEASRHIRMTVGPWFVDEHGNPTRLIMQTEDRPMIGDEIPGSPG